MNKAGGPDATRGPGPGMSHLVFTAGLDANNTAPIQAHPHIYDREAFVHINCWSTNECH